MEGIKKTTIENFVKNYTQLVNNELKSKMLKSIIKTNYVPIIEKKVYLQAMLDNSVVENGGRKYIDMFVNKINVTTAILSMYTNLDLSNGNNKNKAFLNYDLLAKNNLLNVIFNEIPENELATIIDINDQLIETFYNKNSTFEAYISNLVDKFSINFGFITKGVLNPILDLLEDSDKKNEIKSIINKHLK